MPYRHMAFVALLSLGISFPALSQYTAERRSVAHQCQSVSDGRAEQVEFATWTEDGRQLPIDGIVMKPDGQGPFPAIVVLPGSGGIHPPRCYQGALELIVGWGYVGLLIDSYGTGRPDGDGWKEYSFLDQANDAHAGRKFLATLPYVDRRRIGVIGWSRGGGATLAAAKNDAGFRIGDDGPFKAAVAFYPICLVDLDNVLTPLLILIGDADRETPAENCQRLVAAKGQGVAVDLRVYPGVGHIFDARWSPTYNEDADIDAYRRTEEHFARYLK